MAADLTTTYLGLELASPVVASASPLTGALDTLTELEAAGAAAVVLPSLFEEQVERVGDLESMDRYNRGLDAYLEHLAAGKQALSIPVIASLNGSTPGGWVRYARQLQEAGADAIELNVYAIETDPYLSGAAVEERLLRLVNELRIEVSVPLAVKLAPYYTAFANLAARLADARVDGLVLFNRFLQPDIDVDHLTVEPRLELSTRAELLVPLRWLAILHGRLPVSLAATSGVHESEDVVKLVLAGADVVMVASELLRGGVERMRVLRDGLAAWLEEHGFESVGRARGQLSQIAHPDPRTFERAQYLRALADLAQRR
jgi:dihydroorotate dehydrogenase (fumarate)